MSSSTWVNYAIGAVAGIAVGFLTAGAGLAAYATMAGLGTFALTSTFLNAKYATPKMGGLRPPSGFGNAGGQTGMKDAAAASLQINSASESILLPVVFGLCRVSGNNTRYDMSTFRSVPIIERVQKDPSVVAYEMAQRAYKRNPSSVNHQIDRAADKQAAAAGGGGKGGGGGSGPPPSQSYSSSEKIQAYTQVLLENSNGGKKLPKEYDEYIVGYNYFLSWELAICMGPVDALHAVRVYPGEFATVNRSASPEILADETVLAAVGGEQGGTIRFYRGSASQTRNVADVYATPYTNYRGVCFAVMQNYFMGTSPAPSSYAFEIERVPVCLGSDGLPVPGLRTRGSMSALDHAYRDANPAAILWEIFTNKLWGKGIDPALLDTASFVRASQYFADEKIGMSFSLESQTLITQAVETIRSHVATTVVWFGDRLYCKCQLDRESAYTPLIILSRENVSEPSMSRPAWPSTSNELRGTFLNRLNNYSSEIAIAQDMANIATVGRINSTTIDLPAFSTRATTEKVMNRLIGEVSYPQPILTFKMNRFETRLMPGGFFAFQWNEWSAGTITSYWRVQDINDDDQDAGGVKITAAGDLYATAQEGAIDTFTAPIPAFEGQTANEDDDLFYGEDLSAPFDAGDIDLQIAELPINLTDGDRIIAFFTQRLNGQTRGLAIYWRETGSGDDWKLLGNLSPWATTGTLVSGIPATPRGTRDADFEIELRNPTERGMMLELCSTAPTDSDPLDIITGSQTNILRIGNEILQVAQAEAGSTESRVRIKAVLRGQMGTDPEAHSAAAPTAFLYEFVPYAMTLRYDELPLETGLDFMATPYDRYGMTSDPVETTHTIENRARRPFALTRWEASAIGLDWTGEFRPRFHNRGAEDAGDLETQLNSLVGAIPEGYAFYVMPRNGTTELLGTAELLPVTFTADDGNDDTTGMAAFAYTAPATTTNLLVYQAFNGVLGYPTNFTV